MSDLLGADIKAVVMTSELNATHQITTQYQALLQFERILRSENWRNSEFLYSNILRYMQFSHF